MNDTLLSATSDPKTLAKLKAAATVQMTEADRFEQRVSFVFGSLGKNNRMSKSDVRDQLRNQLGGVISATK